MTERRDWLAPIAYLTQNKLSLAGVVVATSAAIFWFFLLPAGDTNPYLGLLTFGLLPAILFAGLVLIPIGLWRQRRSGKSAMPRDPRRVLAFLGAVTLVNLGIASQTAFRATGYMDSVEFCGKTCHSVMKPEFTAYHYSSHSGVECVKCHVGSGAEGYFKAKLNGLHQLISIATEKYHRPIPTPIRNLPGADETCESCHSRGVLTSRKDRLHVIPHFEENEANSPKYSVLLMKVSAIHRSHLSSKRQELAGTSCLTCHNRPAHTFELPENAVDEAIAAGEIDRGLPFARKNAVAALRGARTAAEARVAFLRPYKEGKAEPASNVVHAIFERNVFPEMNIGWGSYPNHLGHQDEKGGCFRCHDGQKATQDCGGCHSLIAMEESNPEVLKALGLVESAK